MGMTALTAMDGATATATAMDAQRQQQWKAQRQHVGEDDDGRRKGNVTMMTGIDGAMVMVMDGATVMAMVSTVAMQQGQRPWTV